MADPTVNKAGRIIAGAATGGLSELAPETVDKVTNGVADAATDLATGIGNFLFGDDKPTAAEAQPKPSDIKWNQPPAAPSAETKPVAPAAATPAAAAKPAAPSLGDRLEGWASDAGQFFSGSSGPAKPNTEAQGFTYVPPPKPAKVEVEPLAPPTTAKPQPAANGFTYTPPPKRETIVGVPLDAPSGPAQQFAAAAAPAAPAAAAAAATASQAFNDKADPKSTIMLQSAARLTLTDKDIPRINAEITRLAAEQGKAPRTISKIEDIKVDGANGFITRAATNVMLENAGRSKDIAGNTLIAAGALKDYVRENSQARIAALEEKARTTPDKLGRDEIRMLQTPSRFAAMEQGKVPAYSDDRNKVLIALGLAAPDGGKNQLGGVSLRREQVAHLVELAAEPAKGRQSGLSDVLGRHGMQDEARDMSRLARQIDTLQRRGDAAGVISASAELTERQIAAAEGLYARLSADPEANAADLAKLDSLHQTASTERQQLVAGLDEAGISMAALTPIPEATAVATAPLPLPKPAIPRVGPNG